MHKAASDDHALDASSRGERPSQIPATLERSLVHVVIAGETLGPLAPLLDADRRQAITDLERENHFVPEDAPPGPYILYLAIRDRRLVFDIRSDTAQPIAAHAFALGPFRRLIKDYHIVVESYAKAVAEGHGAKLEAIDMGRRALHDEAAALMRKRLAGKVTIDLATARRLFTLVAILYPTF